MSDQPETPKTPVEEKATDVAAPEASEEPEAKKARTDEGPLRLKMEHVEIPVAETPRAEKFYADVFGWTTKGGEGDAYKVWNAPKAEGGMDGGLDGEHPEYVGATNFTAVVETADLAKTLEALKAAGGEPLGETTKVGESGLSARFKDTEGNVMGLWQATGEGKASVTGAVRHFMVETTDLARATGFFSTVFGWDFKADVDYKPEAEYMGFASGQGGPTGGLTQVAGPISDKVGLRPFFTATPEVPTSAILARVTAAGGKAVGEAQDMGESNFMSHFADLDGNVFGIYGTL